MKTIVSLSALALTLSAIAAAPAQAAEADGTNDGVNDTIVVTASRSGAGTPEDQVPASITVIDADAMAQRQTRIVSDVLRDVPGVAVNRTGGIGGLTQLRLRGTEGNHVLVLIDGIKVADPYYGEYDFGTLVADPEAKVEVLRGQQSSLYGSDAIGGVIHYITLTGAEAPGVSLRAEGGSFETFSGAARAAGVAGTLDYALSGTWYHTGGYPTARGGTRDTGSDNVGASAKLIWSPSADFSLTGVARYSYTDAQFNNSDYDPTSPTFGYTIDSPGVYLHNKAFYGLIAAEYRAMDGRWINRLSGQIADTERRGYAPYGFDYGDHGRRWKGSFVSSLTLGDTAGLSHRLTAAVDVEREEFRNLVSSPYSFGGWRHTDNVGLVGEYRLDWANALSFGASVRRDENDRFADATTWRVEGGYRFTTGTRIRAAYGTGIKNPGYYELYGYSTGRYIGNPNLRPEQSKGWEVGVDQEIGALASLGVTYFDSRLEDEIYTRYPAPTYVATPANSTTRSKQHGVEVMLSARPIPQIRLDAAYTYTASNQNGVAEVRRPHHIASFNATVQSRDERFSTTLTLRYNGRQTDLAYTDPSYVPVRVSLAEYALVNLSAQYRLTPAVTLFGRVENLTGEEYEELFGFATAGRAGYAGVRVAF
jgi:vitamin B12 transporter